MPVVGDWNGDGFDTMALYDPAMAVFYQSNSLTQDYSDNAFSYGPVGSGWVPLAGDWDGPTAFVALHAVDAGSGVSDPALALAQVDPVAQAALARWADLGGSLSAGGLSADVQFVVTDLPGTLVGATSGSTIYLDVDAAGHGWFIDTTPARDEEFAAQGGVSDLKAIDPRAVDRIDLMTVVEHELGHLAGRHDLDATLDSLMSATLPTGVRRLPRA